MENKALTLVAIVEAKEDKRDFVRAEIVKLLVPTRAERGCVEYVLHDDNKKPNVFLLYETWENYELWQQHMKSAHLEAFAAATKDAVKEWNIYELTKSSE